MAGLWFWLGSSAGRQWVSDTVAAVSGGTVEIRGLQGHPLHEVDAEAVLFKNETTEVTASAVHLAWSPLQLLFMDLDLSALEMETVQVRLLGTEPATDVQPPLDLLLPAIQLDMFRIAALQIEQPDGSTISLDGIRGDGLRFDSVLAGKLTAHLIDPDAAAEVALSGAAASWQLDGRLLSQDRGSLKLVLKGERLQAGTGSIAAVVDDKTAIVEGRWQRQGDDVNGTGNIKLGNGTATFDGSWQLNAAIEPASNAYGAAWQINGKTRSDLLNRPLPLHISGRWAGSALSVVAEEVNQGFRLELQYANAMLEGSLLLKDWLSPLTDAPGQLDGKLTGNWQLQNGNWKLAGDIGKGELAGVMASLKLDGEGEGGNWRLRRADVRALGLSLKAGGKGDAKSFELAGTLSGKDIGPVMKLAGINAAGGSLRADIRLAGAYESPRGDVTATAEALTLENIAINRLDVAAHQFGRDGTLKLKLTGVAMDGRREIDRLDAGAVLKGDTVTLSLASQGRLQGKASATAGFEADGLHELRLNGVDLGYDGVTLLEAKQLVINRDGKGVRLARAPLKLLGSESTFELALNDAQLSGRLDVTGFRLSGAEPWLKSLPYRVGGRADISISLDGTPQAPQLALHLRAPELKFNHAMFADVAEKMLVLSDVSMDSSYRNQRLSWKLHAAAPAGGVIESNGEYALLFTIDPWQMTLPEQRDGSGQLLARFARLSDLQPLMPRIDPFDGSGKLELSWQMPLGVNSVRGDGVIHFDALGVPEFGLQMKGDLQVQLANGKPVVDLVLQGGEGELRIQGDVDVDQRTIPDIRFTRFPLMQLPDQQLTVSGTIRASEQQHVGLVSGDLEVVHMRLEIPEPTPKPTSDLLWEHETAGAVEKKQEPLSKIDVALKISEDAEIYGRGMSLKPKGDLHLGGSLSQPKLTGVLEIASGKIEYRSIKLDILPDSRAIFSGNPARPIVHIRAARKVGDVTAGIIVDGPVDQLTTQLYSTPAMSNSEIFSYIATGRPLATLGKDNASDVMTAAEFILGPGTMVQEVQGKVKQVTGLDIFEVGGDSSGGYVRAGRKISDKVTLTVEQAVSKESSTALTLEYMLSKSFSIFASQTTNLAPRMGLRYSKEWFGTPKTKAEAAKE
ncbi:MAG: hypothetical protein AUJ57_05725 [Zetaproteobacteria bacterium CG1_02_53_45]|nr:MAG: hypothetical protein AUJ57_05725 [Zetaproteobacteria bacterium CG1_02_53_45]